MSVCETPTECSVSGDPVKEEKPEPALSAAQRARIERNRLRARTLQDARLVKRPIVTEVVSKIGISKALDSGGGFLLEEEPPAAPVPRETRPAPLVHPSEQPKCLECGTLFPQSYLFDTFDYAVCDACQDSEGAHALLTRTEAKTEFLLKDCDLDKRPPPLKCIRKKNPHKSSYSEMRLYLRAQVEERALEVWGTEEALEEELLLRREKREKTRHTQSVKKLRALRMDVRSSLFDKTKKQHTHVWGPEAYDEGNDEYSHSCTECGYTENYEKM